MKKLGFNLCISIIEDPIYCTKDVQYSMGKLFRDVISQYKCQKLYNMSKYRKCNNFNSILCFVIYGCAYTYSLNILTSSVTTQTDCDKTYFLSMHPKSREDHRKIIINIV